VVGAAGAGFAGGRTTAGSEPAKAPEPAKDNEALLLEHMKELATGSMAELLQRHAPFLAYLDDHADERLLWLGFERLGQHALLEDLSTLRARLLVTARSKRAPDHIGNIVAKLERG
jgi:hypothetical protein